MENFIVKVFSVLYQTVGILLFCGMMGSVLSDIQKRAFHSKRVGLVSMLHVNQQLVGIEATASASKKRNFKK